jgi:hypothetical protein
MSDESDLLLAAYWSTEYLVAHPLSHSLTPSSLQTLLDFFDREWHLPKRQVLDAEFGAYVHLVSLCVLCVDRV